MNIIITVATGFIGTALAKSLIAHGRHVIALTRNAAKARMHFDKHLLDVKCVQWDAKTADGWLEYAESADAIVNLAGENLAGIWTENKKKKIMQSRVDSGRAVADAVSRATRKPAVVIQASAMGYYGHSPDTVYDESSPPGVGFLAEVCTNWEKSVASAADYTRLAFTRTGIVLGTQGGLLPHLVRAFRFYASGCIGTGSQWFSWISIDDQVRAIRFLMENPDLAGPFNLVSPNPVTMGQFCRELAEILDRPSWLKVPDFLVRIAAADIADELLVTGRKVVPKRLLDFGFIFNHPELRAALTEILASSEMYSTTG